MKRFSKSIAMTLVLSLVLISGAVPRVEAAVQLQILGTYSTGIFNQGASEIAAYDAQSERLFVVNGGTSEIDVISLSDPSRPTLLFSIELSPYGRQANSVAVYNGLIAAAVEASVKTDSGRIVFFDADGNYLNDLTVGALPDMLIFTPNGEKVLVANEGEPNDDYTIDPEGSVSIVDVRRGPANATVKTARFTAFNDAALDPGIRIFGPGATVAEDLEPEYIAVSHNSKTAWVTLQENNAIGILNLESDEFTRLAALGSKNHDLAGNAFDASDRDNAINIRRWPVFGMYQPDSIAAFKHGNETFLITANEGDAREYLGSPGFTEEARVSSLALDPFVFPDAAILKANANLGRLNVTRASGDTDGDGDYDALYAFGSRSFSVWTAAGEQVFDSSDQLEQITAARFPLFFNAGNTNSTSDDRSDNKGPEPEGVAVGRIFGQNYAFIGLERIGGVVVYDLTNPAAPQFVQYLNNRNFLAAPGAAAAGDLGPEGLHFISEVDSPTGIPLLVAANEVSGTTTIYQITRVQ